MNSVLLNSLTLMIATGLLAGCGTASKAAPESQGAARQKNCEQSDWQAQTLPVISKRMGPDDLEKYDSAPEGKEQGCP